MLVRCSDHRSVTFGDRTLEQFLDVDYVLTDRAQRFDRRVLHVLDTLQRRGGSRTEMRIDGNAEGDDRRGHDRQQPDAMLELHTLGLTADGGPCA